MADKTIQVGNSELFEKTKTLATLDIILNDAVAAHKISPAEAKSFYELLEHSTDPWMLKAPIPAGIDRMVIATPNLNVDKDVLAAGATINNAQNVVVDYLSTSDDKVIKGARAFDGMDILNKEGEVEKGHVKHMVNGERQRLIKKVENANSLEKMSKVLEELVKDRIVTQEWAAELEYCMKNEPKKGEVPKHDIWVSPGFIGGGLGIENIKLPGFSEGNATYVANAVYKFIKQVTASSESLKELIAQPIRSIYYAS